MSRTSYRSGSDGGRMLTFVPDRSGALFARHRKSRLNANLRDDE